MTVAENVCLRNYLSRYEEITHKEAFGVMLIRLAGDLSNLENGARYCLPMNDVITMIIINYVNQKLQ